MSRLNTPTARVVSTDAEIDEAIAHANVREAHRPHVVAARYSALDNTIILSLANRVEVAIPRVLLQGLENATPSDLENIKIEGPGSGLHWPALDVDHYVPTLLAGVFGTRAWMAEIGRQGGAARSSAKVAAARANGHRGGRPPLRRKTKARA